MVISAYDKMVATLAKPAAKPMPNFSAPFSVWTETVGWEVAEAWVVEATALEEPDSSVLEPDGIKVYRELFSLVSPRI